MNNPEKPQTAATRPTDDLDELRQALAQESPEFADLLAETGRELAPLAATAEGQPTLTSLRMAAGYTQTELARRIGQKQSNVSQMESGLRVNYQRDTMKKMCAALNCDMNTLDEAIDATVSLCQATLAVQERDKQQAVRRAAKQCA